MQDTDEQWVGVRMLEKIVNEVGLQDKGIISLQVEVEKPV